MQPNSGITSIYRKSDPACKLLESVTMSTETYRDLETWQVSMTLVERCYDTTRPFPRDERFGLTAQMRRAAVSIPSNVAEGACRRKTNVYLNHVSIALGAHGELETCIGYQLCRFRGLRRSLFRTPGRLPRFQF